MNGFLTQQKIDYLLYHLSFHLESQTFSQLQSKFVFTQDTNYDPNPTGKIVFPLSSDYFNFKNVMWINDIPVLFPLKQQHTFYSIENNNLIFHHDILKSAFYLLSGYQEYAFSHKDKLDRFPYSESIQYYLGIIHKPIVNYYFDIILKGLGEYCSMYSLPFQRRTVFNNWKVMLTHDIDRLDTYTIYELAYKIKQFLGLAERKGSIGYHVRLIMKYFFGYLTRRWNNPHWSFNTLKETEQKFNFYSVYYFLRKEHLHYDSYYQYNEKRLYKLFHELTNNNYEIGLHGTYNSALSLDSMKYNFEELSRYSPQPVYGIRQHMLHYYHPSTILLQEQTGLRYDTTLGFAAHEGFRNSYCWPFKLYDFDNERMIHVWEIPLTAMDKTLFRYRELSVEQALESIHNLANETQKFNGVLTFLWHNGFHKDDPNNQLLNFYEEVLHLFSKEHGQSILGKDVVDILGGMSYYSE